MAEKSTVAQYPADAPSYSPSPYPAAPVHRNSFPSQQPAQQQFQPQPTPAMTVAAGAGGNRNALNKPFDQNGKRDWSFGLFDCFDACGTCILSWFCPCVVYGQNQSRLKHLREQGRPHPEGGDTFSSDCFALCALAYCGCPCLIRMGGRKNIRERYNIEGESGGDCLITCICSPCTLTQEAREVELEEYSLLPAGSKA